jgi:hypothetical protein
MNERIQELAEQARKIPMGDSWTYSHPQEFEQRFAELIVAECIQVLVNNTPMGDLVEDWDKGYNRAMKDCTHHIYDHLFRS